jgi:phenylpropionate dioxygenase-like ring-hydroxylating dioxygenase large terminal subunit
VRGDAGQDRIPETARVRSYPVVEQDRFVWVWMGDPARADARDILRFAWHTDPAWALKPGYIHYQAHYQLVVDNLLDFSHLSYVHPTTLGTARVAQVRAQVQPLEDGGLRITRWALDDEMPEPPPRGPLRGQRRPLADLRLAPAGLHAHGRRLRPGGHRGAEGRISAQAMKFRHTSVQTPRRCAPRTTSSARRATSSSTIPR